MRLLDVKKQDPAFFFLEIVTALCFVLAFCFASPTEIFDGTLRILTHPSNLLSDYLVIGGFGATFFNVGLMTALALVMIKMNKLTVTGPLIAAVFTVGAFSFFGKNLFNSLPITLGVYLYTLFNKNEFKQQILVALFGTALAPLVSYVTFSFGLPFHLGLLYGVFLGVLCGFIMPPLASAFVLFHKGFSLYNIGFTAGIVGMVFIGALRFLDWEILAQNMVYQGDSSSLVWVLYLLFAAMALYALPRSRARWKEYWDLMKSSGRLVTDFPLLYDFKLTLFNMGVMGLIATSYSLFLRPQINGPIVGGIFTVVGFSAFGKHPKNVLPVLLGVLSLSFFSSFDHVSTTAVIAALFGTTLAPLAGHYGWIPGIFAGFVHMTTVLNVSGLHSGVNLYNNGFSGGFVAAILVPIFDVIELRGFLPKQIWAKIRAKRQSVKPDD